MSYSRSSTGAQPPRDSTQPRFYMEAVQDEAASAREGRPIFRHEERVQILLPGSPNQPVFRVNNDHIQQWPEHYAAFKRGEEATLDGTPLEQWPILNRSQVLELKALQLFTVEQIADMPDTAMQKIRIGGTNLRNRAKAYLDDAAAIAFSEKLNHENEAQRAEISSLRRQVEEQSEMLGRLSAQMLAIQDRPHPVATYVQGEHDPIAAARQMAPQEPIAASSLDDFAAPVRRGPGRPRKEAEAA